MGTAIYLLTNHISEVQYNNWGNGVWNGLLEIQSDGNCSGNSQNTEYYKACIQKDIKDLYDLENVWNSDYWKNWYQLKTNSSGTDIGGAKNKFLEMRSWEKFREVCTKAFEEMIRKGEWNKLSGAVGPSSSIPIGEINSEECLKNKSVKKK